MQVKQEDDTGRAGSGEGITPSNGLSPSGGKEDGGEPADDPDTWHQSQKRASPETPDLETPRLTGLIEDSVTTLNPVQQAGPEHADDHGQRGRQYTAGIEEETVLEDTCADVGQDSSSTAFDIVQTADGQDDPLDLYLVARLVVTNHPLFR